MSIICRKINDLSEWKGVLPSQEVAAENVNGGDNGHDKKKPQGRAIRGAEFGQGGCEGAAYRLGMRWQDAVSSWGVGASSCSS